MKYTAKKTVFIGSKFLADRAKAEFGDAKALGKFIIDSIAEFARSATAGKGKATILDTYIDGKQASINDLLGLYDNAPAELQVREVAERLDTDYLLITFSKEEKRAWPKLSRHQANCLIMAKLQRLVDRYPDQRFVQLLENFGIVDVAKDLFYEESARTLEKLEAYMK